jgi:hypothetical protein
MTDAATAYFASAAEIQKRAREVCNAIPREHLPQVGTELIARPARKGE